MKKRTLPAHLVAADGHRPMSNFEDADRQPQCVRRAFDVVADVGVHPRDGRRPATSPVAKDGTG
jgi:hypothetical protein